MIKHDYATASRRELIAGPALMRTIHPLDSSVSWFVAGVLVGAVLL